MHKDDVRYQITELIIQINITNQMKKRIKKKLTYTKGNLERATKKLNLEITEQDLIELYKKQRGLCAVTGHKLTCNKTLSDISIDRINSNLGYTKTNVQLVADLANKIKSDIDMNTLYYWMEKILNKCYFAKKALHMLNNEIIIDDDLILDQENNISNDNEELNDDLISDPEDNIIIEKLSSAPSDKNKVVMSRLKKALTR
jgi:hypothetical protein